MPLHPKIDPSELSSRGLLLSDEALGLVAEIEAFIKTLEPRMTEIVRQKELLSIEKRATESELEKFSDPFSYIDEKILPSEGESVDNYKARVLEVIAQFETSLSSDDALDFIRTLKDQFNTISEDDVGALYGKYSEQLEELRDTYEESAQDGLCIERVTESLEAIEQKIDKNEQQEAEQIEVIDAFRAEKGLDFELDERFRLVKISKRSRDLDYSVLYVRESEDEPARAFALYRGGTRALGEGGFGKVILCQALDSGDWMAVKIQKSVMQQDSKSENETLRHFGRFSGEALRRKKYYSVQSLLSGEELGLFISKEEKATFASRLEIATQAATLVKEFHQVYLHRDIKAENYVWNPETEELTICDFGMARKLAAGEEGVEDLSGSGTILAPEIDDALHPGMVLYTTKSDIYALGKVFEELFEGVEDVPHEISELVDRMMKADPDERIDNAGEIEAALTVIRQGNMEERIDTPSLESLSEEEQSASPVSVGLSSHSLFRPVSSESERSVELDEAPAPSYPSPSGGK